MKNSRIQQSRLTNNWLLLILLPAIVLLGSCGGGGGSNPTNQIAVSVVPASATVCSGSTQQFAATVSNATATAVNWQVNGQNGGSITLGTISSTGLYSAPLNIPNPSLLTLTAISQADTSKSGSAMLTITSSPSWQNIGPSASAITAFVVDPKTPATLYAATSQGLFKSTDGGRNWADPSNGAFGFFGGGSNGLLIDPVTPTTLYTGTVTEGVWKTVDGGVNWTASIGGQGSLLSAQLLAIDRNNPSTLYASFAQPELLRFNLKTIDGGKTWGVGFCGDNPSDLVLDPTDSNTFYAESNTLNPVGQVLGRMVIKSADGGKTCTPANTGLPSEPAFLTIDPKTPSTLYAAMASSGVFKSTDRAAHWNLSSTGLEQSKIGVLAIDPVSPSTLYAGTADGKVFKSSNAGGNWTSLGCGLPNGAIGLIAVDPLTPTTVYATTPKGVFVLHQ